MGAAGIALGLGVWGAYQSYQNAKLQEEIFKQKAIAAKQLGEHNATVTINNTIAQTNELSAQSNIIALNEAKAVTEIDRQFTEASRTIADEYSKLVLQTSGSFSSYDYLKAAQKQALDKLTDFDMKFSDATYQSSIAQKENDRKISVIHDLGLANAEFVKYKANLEAYGLQAQGTMAYAQGINAAIGQMSNSVMSYVATT